MLSTFSSLGRNDNISPFPIPSEALQQLFWKRRPLLFGTKFENVFFGVAYWPYHPHLSVSGMYFDMTI